MKINKLLTLLILALLTAMCACTKKTDSNKVLSEESSKDTTKNIRSVDSLQEEVENEDDDLQIPIMTEKETKEYFNRCKKDPDIKLLRKVLDKYLANKPISEDLIDSIALDSMTLYKQEYLESKFVVGYVENCLFGGDWLYIIFIDKPDKVFAVWALHGRIAMFEDANWSKKRIKVVHDYIQTFDHKFGL